MVPNRASQAPKNSQRVILPVVVDIRSDAGGVSCEAVKAHLGPALDRVFSEDLFDRFDRNPDDPPPFSLDGAKPAWEFLHEVTEEAAGDLLLVARLTSRQVRMLTFSLRYLKANMDDCRDLVFAAGDKSPADESDVEGLGRAVGVEV